MRNEGSGSRITESRFQEEPYASKENYIMERQEIATTENTAAMLEDVLVNGDLAKLSASQRLDYYRQVCQSMGLNPLSKPFDYIVLNGKMTLCARKDAADQLRKINGVSIDNVDINTDGDFICVTAHGHDKTGRSDVEVGVVSKRDMRGDYANAMMKAVTKSKRRLTLSLCGLGWLDETEVETIPGARVGMVDTNTGELLPSGNPQTAQAAPAAPTAWDEEDFLRNWQSPTGTGESMPRAKAEAMTDNKGKLYGEKSTYELYNMMRVIEKRLPDYPEEKKAECSKKLVAIKEILKCRKMDLTVEDPAPCPFVEEGGAE